MAREQTGCMRWRLLFGLLCIALVMLSGTLSVAHGHADGTLGHADCGLCATAHLTAQLVAVLPDAPATLVFTRLDGSLPPLRPRTLVRSALFTRPPPSQTHLTS